MASERIVTISPDASLLLRVVMDEYVDRHLLTGKPLHFRLTTKKGTVETALCYFAAILAFEAQQSGTVSLLPRKLEPFRDLFERRNVPLPSPAAIT